MFRPGDRVPIEVMGVGTEVIIEEVVETPAGVVYTIGDQKLTERELQELLPEYD